MTYAQGSGRKNGRLRAFAVALAVVSGPAAGPARATDQSFSGDYAVSYLGLTIARSTFQSRFDGNSFSVKGSVASAGLAVLFDDTKGTISTTGHFAAGTPQAGDFRVDYISGKKRQLTAIGFRDGAVTKTVNEPPLKTRRDNWVPIEPAHLKAVTDPLSATLVQAANPGEVCNRTVHIYDGEMRADLTLTPDSTDEIDVPGYAGQTVVCRLGFTPVSGYRQGRRALEFLKNKSEMRIAFAPIGTTGIYAPIHATIGTQIGTLTVSARHFGIQN